MEIDPLVYKIAFSSIRRINPSMARILLEKAGSEERVMTLDENGLTNAVGYKNMMFSLSYRSTLVDNAITEAKRISDAGIQPLYFTDNVFPRRLLQCEDAPIMLYTLGETDLNNALFISIVGTRHATVYGIDFTCQLVKDLAAKLANPLVVVSGLAYGIDITAHRAAIDNNLPTVAVMAQGLNSIYPSAHRNHAVDIIRKGGMLLTEYRLSEKLNKGNFLARNRIVAGLSDCTMVVESAKRGGSLATARLAQAYNREVLALPGRISDTYSAGCNHLIASDRAMLITSASDLIAYMNWPQRPEEGSQPSLFQELTADEQKIVDALTSNDHAEIADLMAATGMSIPKLTPLLIDMEFSGIILSAPGGHYRLAKSI